MLRPDRDPADAILRQSGPLMVIANHPFGVVDGIILCWLVSQVRPDYQIMTHRVLHQAPEVRPRILPVDFSGTEAARGTTCTRAGGRASCSMTAARCWCFPAAASRRAEAPSAARSIAPGARSPPSSRSPPMPPCCRSTSTAEQPLVPGRLNIHQTLRYALLFHEVRNKIGRRIDVTIGDVIAPERLQKIGDLRAATDFLRIATHALTGIAANTR